MARILHLIAADHRRGAETFAVELAAFLRGCGHEVRVLAVEHSGSKHPLPVEVAGSSRWSPSGWGRIVEAGRWSDLVVSFGSTSLAVGAAAAHRCHRPFVYRSIGDPAVWRPRHGADLRVGGPVRSASRVVALWPAAAATLQSLYRVPPERVRIIPRGVTEQRFTPADPARRAAARRRLGLTGDRPWVAFVGALSEEKDPLLAVEAAAHAGEPVGVLVAGDGPLREALVARAEDLGVRLRLAGETDDVGAVYAAADALVLPSRTEGIPGVAIEAGLCALPVVTFPVGGTAEVVVDGVTGVLAPSRAPEVLGAAITDALAHARPLGAAARARCLERFSMDVVGGRWDDLIRELAPPTDRPRARRLALRRGEGTGVAGLSPDRRTQVVQVAATAQRRGAEVFAAELGAALSRNGLSVSTVAVSFVDDRRPLGFPVLGARPWSPTTVLRLTRAVGGSQVVVVHGSSGLWPALVACTVTRRPFVYRSIGDPTFWGRRRWARTRTGWALRRAARVVALSEGLRDALVAQYRLDPARVVVSPNAVDADRFPAADDADRLAARRRLGLDAASPLLGYLGALSPEKRPEWAVRAVAGLPGARLVMAGAGPSEEAVRELAGRIAPGRVALLAPLEDPWPLLAAVDVLLVPSRTEGMPGVVIEAGLVGRPVVATAVGAVPEMIGMVAGGAAVDPDDLDGFVGAVARVLNGGGAPGPDRAAVAAAHGIGAVAPAWSALLSSLTTASA